MVKTAASKIWSFKDRNWSAQSVPNTNDPSKEAAMPFIPTFSLGSSFDLMNQQVSYVISSCVNTCHCHFKVESDLSLSENS